MAVKASNALNVRPFEIVGWGTRVFGHVEGKTKFLFVVQVGVNIILWRLLRVQIGAGRGRGAVIELNDMLPSRSRGPDLKHSGAIRRHP